LVIIGKVLRTQGRKGELRVDLYPEKLAKPFFFSRIGLRKKDRIEEYQVESLRLQNKDIILKLKGVDSLNESLKLVGAEVMLSEPALQALEKGHYYDFQLIGCSVITEKNEEIGKVEAILRIKDNDLLVVREKKKEVLIPFVESICIEVNVQEKIIVVNPPDGLLDLNEI